MATSNFPDLDRRLLDERSAIADTASALRRRLRHSAGELRPSEQLRRHPGAAMAAAALGGLIAGRLAGRLLAFLLVR